MLGNKKSKIRFFVFLTGLFLFLNSCGLDTFVVVDAPTQVGNMPNVDTTDFSLKYFQFTTNNDLSHYPTDFHFLGTNVYYKIYTNSSDLRNHTSVLNSLAEDEETSANAPTRLIEGYSYQQLKSNLETSSVLVPVSDIQHQDVVIRLTSYQNDPNFAAKITVDDYPLALSTSKTVPLRYMDGLSFNFGRTGEIDKVPQIGDADVYGSSPPSDGIWYVALYAVGLGNSVTFEQQYSNIVYLGAIAIDANSPDN